jgi:nucleoside-diphosphate-sugar epimerase
MRVALTGAAGFTGAYVQEALARRGLACISLAADLTDPAAVEAELAGAPFDTLIHLAGEAFAAGEDWRRFYEVNLMGTLTLLGAAAALRPGARCVLASSAQVYGPEAAGRVDEEQPTRPNTHYAFSKLGMETCARAFAGSLDLVITRPFNYTGVGQDVRYVIPKIVDHFRRRAPRIELGNIEVRRDFGDVRSVAEAYVGLALADVPPPLVNIGTGRSHSIGDIVALASRITGHNPELDVNPAFVRPNDVPELLADCGRLAAALPDWRPRDVEDTIAWMLEAVE